MKPILPATWAAHLEGETSKPYFIELMQFIDSEYQQQTCYPPQAQIFSAFEKCAFDDVKVVIIGQDPYHGQGQAHGMCFSVGDDIALPPSLKNIFRELESDLECMAKVTGNLNRWAANGVLLLNAVLTVRAGQAGSHQNKGWEKFTDAVIKVLSDQKSGLVFMLWGGYAKKKGSKIDSSKHLVLQAGHPSPLSANKGHWFGNKHFSQANAYLKSTNQDLIDW